MIQRQVALIVGLLFYATTSATAEVIMFDPSDNGRLPSTFEIGQTGKGGPARWEVVRDQTAKGGHALAQLSQDTTDYRFPLAIYKPFSGVNVDVQIRFKPVSGTVDQAGGIALRLTTPNDYYVVRANALEDNVRFYRVVKGERIQLATADVTIASGQWHTLGLKADGQTFTISFGGKPLYSATDGTFTGPGKIALWTKADSVTHFDQLEINPGR